MTPPYRTLIERSPFAALATCGHLSVDPDLLNSFRMEGKAPRTMIVITIAEICFQCARAIVRADL